MGTAHPRGRLADTFRRVPARSAGPGGDPGSFDRLADHYDRLGHLVDRPVADLIAAHLPTGLLPVGRARRAVDLGCGTGRHTALLAGRFDEVLAVDVSKPMLEFAGLRRPAPNIRYERRDLRSVTVQTDGQFDFVVSVYTLHHLPNPGQALARIRRLVAPGGTVLLVDLCDEQHSTGWFRREARHTLAADLRHRRRPVRQAVQLYRLSVARGWLAHQASDAPLPPGTFETVYRGVFPGATFNELDRARGMSWHHRPADPLNGWARP
jgi:SAM-dependent methyltransferase